MKQVAFLVTHLLGSGHLSRTLTLARAVRDAGHRAMVISGGMPAGHLDETGIDFRQLPPVRSDGSSFSRLLDRDNNLADETLYKARGEMIAAILRDNPPDALVTELFPFGRRLLRGEFGAALSLVRSLPNRPVVLSSIRDIPAPPGKPKKLEETEDWLARFYDGVLVHSDPRVVRLDDNWPMSPLVERMVRYTGFVTPPAPAADLTGTDGAGEIIVTAGGGPTGRRLFATAVEAARIGGAHRWRLLVGGADAASVSAWLNELAAGAPAHAEPVRRDYRQMLTRCAAAVGQCGYNTAMDWLQAGVPGVFVPFAESGEVEQTIRARALEARYGYDWIAEEELTAEKLAAEVARAVSRGRRPVEGVDMDGAAGSARIILDFVEERRAA